MYWESDLPSEKIRESFPMWQSARKLGQVWLPDRKPAIHPSGAARSPIAVSISLALLSLTL
jgi:hypothetical protein